MGDAVEVGMVMLTSVAGMGLLGYRIARSQGRSPLLGLAMGGLLPLVGLGVLLMMGKKNP